MSNENGQSGTFKKNTFEVMKRNLLTLIRAGNFWMKKGGAIPYSREVFRVGVENGINGAELLFILAITRVAAYEYATAMARQPSLIKRWRWKILATYNLKSAVQYANQAIKEIPPQKLPTNDLITYLRVLLRARQLKSCLEGIQIALERTDLTNNQKLLLLTYQGQALDEDDRPVLAGDSFLKAGQLALDLELESRVIYYISLAHHHRRKHPTWKQYLEKALELASDKRQLLVAQIEIIQSLLKNP